MIEILIHVVDDSKAFLFAATDAFRNHSGKPGDSSKHEARFRVFSSSKGSDWIAHIESLAEKPDVCLLDISMHDDDEAGLKLANYIRKRCPDTIVVMLSQYDDSDTILKFMEAGADSFISKKTTFAALPSEVLQAYRVALRKRKAEEPLIESSISKRCAGATLESIFRRIPDIMRSAIRAVHVSGETGTGKEVVADLVEAALRVSDARAPFVRINCGALSPSLLESELFGHVKGAFTGASHDKSGLLESANGGWVFLDEVASLPPPAQAALLRVLENQEVLRLGENRPRKLRIRVLSACNESLEEKVRSGAFRLDLWQRLLEAQLNLSPLRERKTEIEPIVRFLCRELDGGPYEVTSTALELLKRHDWQTGNVRELRNCLRAMTEFSETRVLGPHSIPRGVFEAIIQQNRSSQLVREHSDKKQSISFDFTTESLRYDVLEARLFASLVRHLASNHSSSSAKKRETITLRDIEEATGLSRMTISRKLKDAVLSGQLTQEMLPDSFWARNLAGVTQKKRVGRPRKNRSQ